MTVSRLVKPQVSAVLAKSRFYSGDEDATQYRWSNAKHLERIAEAYVYLQNLRQATQHHAEVRPSATFSYSHPDTALPAECGFHVVTKCEDMTQSDRPREIDYVEPEMIEQAPRLATGSGVSVRKSWSVIASSSDAGATNDRLVIRPQLAAALTVRVWYFVMPETISATTDEMRLLVPWQQLIALLSASYLCCGQGEFPDQSRALLYDQLETFKKSGRRGFRGGIDLPRKRVSR